MSTQWLCSDMRGKVESFSLTFVKLSNFYNSSIFGSQIPLTIVWLRLVPQGGNFLTILVKPMISDRSLNPRLPFLFVIYLLSSFIVQWVTLETSVWRSQLDEMEPFSDISSESQFHFQCPDPQQLNFSDFSWFTCVLGSMPWRQLFLSNLTCLKSF